MLRLKKAFVFSLAIALVNASPTPFNSGCECTEENGVRTCSDDRCEKYGYKSKQNILI